jgi:hypothetical protein
MTETDKHRPYAGQSWAPGIVKGNMVTAFLDIVAKDLREDARLNGIGGDDLELELWGKDNGVKGIFFGDTSSLVDDGWTKLVTF